MRWEGICWECMKIRMNEMRRNKLRMYEDKNEWGENEWGENDDDGFRLQEVVPPEKRAVQFRREGHFLGSSFQLKVQERRNTCYVYCLQIIACCGESLKLLPVVVSHLNRDLLWWVIKIVACCGESLIDQNLMNSDVACHIRGDIKFLLMFSNAAREFGKLNTNTQKEGRDQDRWSSNLSHEWKTGRTRARL